MEITKLAFMLFLASVVFEVSTFYKPQAEVAKTSQGQAQESKKVDFEARRSEKTLKGAVTIEYCQTCSYKTRVTEIKSAIQEIYPSTEVYEDEYPIPAIWSILSYLISYIRMAGILLLLAGDNIFAYFQMNYPEWYLKLKNNKIQTGVFLFFGLNLISNWVVSTGAFEVIYDGTLLYSGLKAGKLPSVEEVVLLLNEMAN